MRERIAIDSRFDSYLYNGADLYVYSDDHTTATFHVDGATGNTTVAGTLTGSGTYTTTALVVTGASDLVGNISSSTGAVSVTDNLYVSGTSDLVGNVSSSTGALTVTDDLRLTGALEVIGAISNPSYYITITDHVDIQNTLNYGTDDLYPIGSEDSNFQFSWGTTTVTGTAALTTQKVDSPTQAWCTIASATFTSTTCSTFIAGTTVTASVWLSDGTASNVGVDLDWLVIGIP